jgi:hypothetical protein
MMQQEVFPDSASFLNPWTRQELQQGDTCTCFGLSSSAEAMAHRAGVNLQISPYFCYYYMDKRRVSVEEAIRTANRVGYCPDDLYPFAGFPLQPPGLAALQYGSLHADGFATERINGKKGLMRAICQGSAIITDRYGVAMEHVEACIGYDKDKGFLIQGSGLVTDYWPWEELPKFTQLHKYTKSPFGFIPFPGYTPADPPKFDNGKLTIPLMLEYTDWQTPAVEVLNVVGTITDLASAIWDQDLSTDEPMWKKNEKELHLPTLDFYGTLYKGVIVKGVVWTYEKDKA